MNDKARKRFQEVREMNIDVTRDKKTISFSWIPDDMPLINDKQYGFRCGYQFQIDIWDTIVNEIRKDLAKK